MRITITINFCHDFLLIFFIEKAPYLMSLASVLLTYIISVTTFLILPGPVNLFVANSTLKYGIKGTFCAIVGTNLASLVLIAIAGFLIAGADSINSLILDVLTLLGGLFLLYYGAVQVREVLQRKSENIDKVEKRQIVEDKGEVRQFASLNSFKLISQAFAIGISNPKDVIFFIAFFPPFILQMGFPIPYSLLILTLIWCILDYTLLFAYGVLTNRFIKGAFETVFSVVCGILFCAIGIYALYLALMAIAFS